jgi:hypothetical protein
MLPRMIDIAVPLRPGIKQNPSHLLTQIEYLNHYQTASTWTSVLISSRASMRP